VTWKQVKPIQILRSLKTFLSNRCHKEQFYGHPEVGQLIHSENGITLVGVEPITEATLFLVSIINLAIAKNRDQIIVFLVA
jgi:hypothetical protein